MKKLFLPLLLCFLLAIPLVSVGQQTPQSTAAQPTSAQAESANASQVPDKAEVLKLLDLMHARAQMVQVLDGMAKQMRAGAEDGFRQKVPDATPEQLAKVDKMCDLILGSMPVDEMLDAIVPIYQKHLTKADLAAITAFYSSPAGQKILKEMPAIMAEAMQAGGEIGRRVATSKSQELEQQIDELVKDSKKQ
jgi:hypothetical protein